MLILFISYLSLNLFAADLPEVPYETPDLSTKIVRELARLEISGGLDLVDLNLFDGVNASLKYRYENEPSYTGAFHLRSDLWRVNVDVQPGQLLADIDNQRFGLGFNKGTEILFIRPFKSKKDSLIALPYHLNRLPLTADRVLDRLQIGDLVVLNSYLNLAVSAKSLPTPKQVTAHLATHYIVSGEFQIHITKRSDTQVQVKLIMAKTKSAGVNATIGFPKDTFKVTGLKIVNRRIERLFDATEFFQFNVGLSSGQMLLMDYFMDLKHKDIAKLYDQIFNKFYTLKVFNFSNPFKSFAQSTHDFITDLTMIDEVVASEQLRPVADRRIEKQFNIFNEVAFQIDQSIKIGLVLFNFKNQHQYVDNAIVLTQLDQSKEHYRLHLFEQSQSSSAFFSFWRAQIKKRASFLFKTDASLENNLGYEHVIFDWEYRDKKLDLGELDEVRQQLSYILPANSENSINWSQWLGGYHHLTNARILMSAALNQSALKYLERYSYSQFYYSLLDYLRQIPMPVSLPQSSQVLHDGGFVNGQLVEDKFRSDIETISRLLAIYFDQSHQHTNKEKGQAMASLQYNPLFTEIGAGFLISLLPLEQRSNYIYINMAASAEEHSTLVFNYGKSGNYRINDIIQYVRAVFSRQTVDLFLESGSYRQTP